MSSTSSFDQFDSMKVAKVYFLDIKDQYDGSQDVVCNYAIKDYNSQDGDRIAIFKVGWTHIKDYFIFEWAPIACAGCELSVTFNRHVLPRDESQLYQFCYINGKNELYGASSSFRFVNTECLRQSTKIMQCSGSRSPSHRSIELQESNMEISRLREENLLLRETLKALLARSDSKENGEVREVKDDHSQCKNYDSDIAELRHLVLDLKKDMKVQQEEIKLLTDRIKEAGEEYKKLYVEKIVVQRKYNSLKAKISNGKCKESVASTDESNTMLLPRKSIDFDLGELKSMPPFPLANMT